jgi:hypothetical protein
MINTDRVLHIHLQSRHKDGNSRDQLLVAEGHSDLVETVRIDFMNSHPLPDPSTDMSVADVGAALFYGWNQDEVTECEEPCECSCYGERDDHLYGCQ